MGRIVVSEFVSLDGVMEDPGGSEGTPAGGWAFRFERGADGDAYKLEELRDAEAMLLGRVTYEGFAAAWPSIEDEQGFAEKMNGMPKYVVSSTLERADWQNSTILPGDPVSYTYGRTDNRGIPIYGQTGDIAQPGMQGFPGFSPTEAVNLGRHNIAFYVDAESQVTQRLLLGAAVRHEHYSDFGGTTTGKVSLRFDANDSFAVRGTLATGFRAPGVQQLFYSQRSTNLDPSGTLTDTLTARQNSAVTRAFDSGW